MKANELKSYMELNGLDRVVVEVVDTNVPAMKYQKAKKLAQKLIIRSVNDTYATENTTIYIEYSIYNSFKKSGCYVPLNFELTILDGEVGQKILEEYDNGVGGLEKEFTNVFNTHKNEINAKLAEAGKYLEEAEQLAEKYGIPFYSNISFLGQSYYPASYGKKFKELDRDFVSELTNAYPGEYGDNVGWEHSAVC
jgi:hypothetical protein